MSLSSVLQASLYHLRITDYPASSVVKGLLCFISKGQQPLVIVPGLCVYSSVMPWHLCGACSQANRLCQHQPERRPQVSGADFVPTWALIPKDWHGTHILWCSCAHCSHHHGEMGQKAGLSNIYLYAVQGVDSVEWENALCLDQCGNCMR